MLRLKTTEKVTSTRENKVGVFQPHLNLYTHLSFLSGCSDILLKDLVGYRKLGKLGDLVKERRLQSVPIMSNHFFFEVWIINCQIVYRGGHGSTYYHGCRLTTITNIPPNELGSTPRPRLVVPPS